jgi:hypothetical protein
MLGTTKMPENEPLLSLTVGFGVRVAGDPFNVAAIVSFGPNWLPTMVTFAPGFTELDDELPTFIEMEGAAPIFIEAERAVLAKTSWKEETQSIAERNNKLAKIRIKFRNI